MAEQSSSSIYDETARTDTEHEAKERVQPFEPSNPVHARVGNLVLYAARDGIRRGLKPEAIIREIVAEHHVHINLSELRLLLASRQRPRRPGETNLRASYSSAPTPQPRHDEDDTDDTL